MTTTDRWVEVGAAVRERREQLGVSQVELAQAANVSETTVRVLETARRTAYRRGSLVSIAKALSWPDDAFDRMAAGRPADEPMASADGRTVEERLAALEADLAELKAKFVAGRGRSTPDEQAEFVAAADRRRALRRPAAPTS